MTRTSGATRHRLLLVDDEEPILFALSDYFSVLGYRVDCARELEEAEALLAHVEYACVVADLRLTGAHGAEGLELVGFVRRSCAATGVILLTAYGSPELELAAQVRGVDAYLPKPIGLSALADVVGGLVGRAVSLVDRILSPGAITTLFQPIVELTDEGPHLHGVEALTRGPNGTNMHAADVMFEYVRIKGVEPIVDRCCIASALAASSLLATDCALSFNVHATTLARDRTFASMLARELDAREIDPSRVALEIVEHSTPLATATIASALAPLRAAGVRVALDDFGLGHSNLKMVLDLSPDVLKLDRCFVSHVATDARRRAIVECVVELASQIGARVVAEGIEDEATLEVVRAVGIELAQGYFFSRPLPAEALDAHPLVRARRASASPSSWRKT